MNILRFFNVARFRSTAASKVESESAKFENVFSFPFVKNFALVNRLKVYHFYGSCVVLPTSGLMEIFNVVPAYSFLTAAYIGVTGGAVLSVCTLPFKNIIGQLYISEDNKLIKISAVDFFGKRNDKIVPVDDWVPLLDMKQRNLDAIFLQPTLRDGTKYKLFIKFGIVKNNNKMSQVLE